MTEKKSNKVKEFLSTYKFPIIVLTGIYLGLIFVFGQCIITNDIHLSQFEDRIVIEVVKK
jgi:hypothetical protein